MSERWLPVVGWEELYEVSDQGRVRSLPHTTLGRSNGEAQVVMPFKGRVLKPYVKPTGHVQVRLSDGPRFLTRAVHRLVLEAFVGARPDGLEACHGDGDPQNNRLENLRWDTRQANVLDKVRHGGHPFANKTHCPQGHPYSPENTYVTPKGGRSCVTCRRTRAAERYARKKTA